MTAEISVAIEYVSDELTHQLSRGLSRQLNQDIFTVGRSPACNLVVENPRVSRLHVELWCNSEGPLLRDRSTNGTFLNGERVAHGETCPLRDNDLVQIASVLVLRLHDPTSTIVGGTTRPYLSSRLWLEPGKQRVYVQRQPITPALPIQQFQLLQMLYDASGNIVTRDTIAYALWPEAEGCVTEAMIDNMVARLRRRLKETVTDADFIETVRGVGYRLRL